MLPAAALPLSTAEKKIPAQARAALVVVHTAIETQAASIKTPVGRQAFWDSLAQYAKRSLKAEAQPPAKKPGAPKTKTTAAG